MELLSEISRTPSTTPAELGTRLHVRVQSLTDSINELLARGLIVRRPDESDRRRQLIDMTGAGAKLLPTVPNAMPGCRRRCSRT